MAGDRKFDESLSAWLVEAAPSRLPERVLEATFEQTRRSRQDAGWRVHLGNLHLRPVAASLGGASVVVVAVSLALGVALGQLGFGGRPPLPALPDAWQRVPIETPSGVGSVVSLAAGPRGLLAVVRPGGGGPGQLFVSPDGRTWSPVPADDHPPVPAGDVALAGTGRGFMLVGAEAWISEDGFDWQRLGDPAGDPDLRQGTVLAVAAGGPGYVAVGSDNRAWYSTDGSDWALAQVPPPPTQFFASQGFAAPTVEMLGVAVAGDRLVAWGLARRHLGDSGMNSPVMWASDDGRTWTSVLDPVDGDQLTAAAGPGGFVAVESDYGATVDADQVAVRVSADGRVWEPVAVLGATWSEDADQAPVQLGVKSIAASASGYVAAGGLGPVCGFTCEPGDVVIWTSVDGRSWSPLSSDERFARGTAFDIAAWGSVFVVGGDHEGNPAVWIGGAP